MGASASAFGFGGWLCLAVCGWERELADPTGVGEKIGVGNWGCGASESCCGRGEQLGARGRKKLEGSLDLRVELGGSVLEGLDACIVGLVCGYCGIVRLAASARNGEGHTVSQAIAQFLISSNEIVGQDGIWVVCRDGSNESGQGLLYTQKLRVQGFIHLGVE